MRPANSMGIVAYLLVVLSYAIFSPCTSAAVDGLAENASSYSYAPPAISKGSQVQAADGSTLSADALEARLTTKADAPSPKEQEIPVTNSTDEPGEPETKIVSVDVINDDDDRVDKISLEIDSKDCVEEEKITDTKGGMNARKSLGNYPVDPGIHWFNITWSDPDPDPNKVYQLNQSENITKDDTTVVIHIPQHPDSKLQVTVKNETERETAAYLYIDGEFKDSLTLQPRGWNNFKEVPVDKGVHKVSVRWLWPQDPGNYMEYEKNKMVTVEGNKESVYFVATKGMEVVEKPSPDKTAGKAEETTESDTPQVAPPHQNKTGNDTVVALKIEPKYPGKIETLYIYLFMLLIAIYLAFRR